MSSPTLSFDGTDDWVNVGDKYGLEVSPLSVSAWVYANTLESTNKRLIDNAPDAGFTGGYRLLNNTSGAIEAEFGGRSGGADVVLPFDENTWTHLCVTQDSNRNVDGYVNGEKVGSDTNNNSLTSSVPFKLGKQNANTHYWDGQMDDVRVFSFDSLTKQQVNTVMNGGIIGTEAAHYSMNEGTGTTLTDATDNNYTGTIHGASWSTRSDGNTYTWSTAADWDVYQSEDDVAHDPDSNVGLGEDVISIGQHYDHLTTATEEAYYPVVGPNAGGGTVIDRSPTGNDGTLNGTTKGEEPLLKFTGSLDFDGTDDYVELPSVVWSNTNFVAAEAWVNLQKTSEAVEFIWAKDADIAVTWNDLTSQGFSVRIHEDDTGSFGPTGLSTNTWHHVNIYWDIGTEIGMSVNGSSWYTYATTDGVSNGMSNTIHLGQSANGYYHFDGKMTELRFVTGQRIDRDESLYQTDGTLLTGQKPYNG